MAGEATKAIDKSVLWGGGRSPFSVSYGKMMMWFFLVSDALTFSGLLVAYGFARHSYTGQWPIGEEVFHAFPFMGHTHLPLLYVDGMDYSRWLYLLGLAGLGVGSLYPPLSGLHDQAGKCDLSFGRRSSSGYDSC